MSLVASKLCRQIRGKAKEIDRLLSMVDVHFPAQECSSQLLFEESLKKWTRRMGLEEPDSRNSSVSESVLNLIGGEGENAKLDLSVGFEMIREMSRHTTGLQIVLEWSELVKQSISADNVSDRDLIGIERGAMLIDRVATLVESEEDDAIEDEIEEQPLFGPEYQTSALHPMDMNTIEELDEIAEAVHEKLSKNRDETGHVPSEVEVLHELNNTIFNNLGYQGAPPQEWFTNTNNRLKGVLKTRRGSPVPLCIIHAAVAERVGLQVRGVKVPNYFLIRVSFGQSNEEIEVIQAVETKENQVDNGTAEDIKKGTIIEVYWNGDDKWYPAEVEAVDGDNVLVSYWDNDSRHRRLKMENMNQLPDLHKDTLVFRLLVNRSAAERELTIGRRVEVFWTNDRTWYPGTVKWVDFDSGAVYVRYDDGDERNTTLSIENFGLAPARKIGGEPPKEDLLTIEEKGEQKLVFRLFDRPFSDESDSTSCFVDPYKGGKVLSHADTSNLLRDNGIQASKFRSHLAPVRHPVVWMALLKHMSRMAAAAERQDDKMLWSNQLADLKKLEQHSKTEWTPSNDRPLVSGTESSSDKEN